VPCGAQYLDAVQLTLEQIDIIKRLAELHPESMSIATSVDSKLQLVSYQLAYDLWAAHTLRREVQAVVSYREAIVEA